MHIGVDIGKRNRNLIGPVMPWANDATFCLFIDNVLYL